MKLIIIIVSMLMLSGCITIRKTVLENPETHETKTCSTKFSPFANLGDSVVHFSCVEAVKNQGFTNEIFDGMLNKKGEVIEDNTLENKAK